MNRAMFLAVLVIGGLIAPLSDKGWPIVGYIIQLQIDLAVSASTESVAF